MPTERFILKGENRTDAAFNAARRNMAGLRTAFAGLAGAIGVGVLVGLTKQVLNAGDEIQKLAIKTGASTEALSQLGHAAKLSGTDLGTVTKSMQQMQRSAVEAASGTQSYAEAYQRLGIDVAKFVGLKPEQQLEVMASALSRVDNAADRTALAMETMGRAGTQMLPLLEGGAKGLRDMRAEADALGLTLDQTAATDMARANDAMERLKASFSAITLTLVKAMGPAIAEVADWLRSVLPDALAFAGRGVDKLRAVILSLVAGVVKLVEWTNRLGSILPDALGGATFQANADELAATYELLTGLATDYWTGLDGAAGTQRQFATDLVDTAGVLTGTYIPAVQAAAEAKRTLGSDLLTGIDTSPDFGPDPTGAQFDGDRRTMLVDEMEALRTRFATELELLTEFQAEKQALIDEAAAAGLISKQEHDTLEQQLEAEHQEALLGLKRQGVNSEMQLRQSAIGSVIGLMQMFAGKSKALALAALVFEKGKAIADIIIQSQVAAARALAELGPIAGPPAAASILAWGKISAGVVAATGIAQAAGGGGGGGIGGITGGGGGGGGSEGTTFASSQATQPARRVVNVNLGDDDQLITGKAVRNLIAMINEAVGDGVELVTG